MRRYLAPAAALFALAVLTGCAGASAGAVDTKTPAPAPISADDQAAAATECRDALLQDVPTYTEATFDGTFDPALTEFETTDGGLLVTFIDGNETERVGNLYCEWSPANAVTYTQDPR
ncbi:hypothetical protein [Gulosibacter faecalis]|uniref:Lipoprotein n=1 Tax=Gulosibacter faecalis TaxID=272240 RepID=A0ABW5UUP5_9MICO|nr:hypothetical protein [Gulosibacter faecalis]